MSDGATAVAPPDVAYPPAALELPAAVLWHRRESGGPGALPASLASFPGIVQLGADLLGVLPVAGDPACFDVAAALGARLIATTPEHKLRVLLFPGTVRRSGRGYELLADPVLEALAGAPALAPGTVHLTARAGQALEAASGLSPAGTLESAAGHAFPLLALAGEAPSAPPYRNRELLGRELRWVRRELEEGELLTALAGSEVLRLTGPLGSGKSRLAWEVTRPRAATVHWISLSSRRAARLGGLDFATQLAHYLGLPAAELSSPLVAAAPRAGEQLLVIDGLEAAGSAEWEMLRPLLTPNPGRGLRLLLIGRTGTRWPAECRRSSILHLTALAGETEELFARQVFSNLSIPGAVETRLREAANGNPFALEEGVVQLATLRQLRRFYGSFFFGGDATTGYRASPRWVRHLEAETSRLGEPMPLRLQALAAERVPPDQLARASARLGTPVAAGWQANFLATHWLRAAEGPWGEGVSLADGALREGLVETVAAGDRQAARRCIGEELAPLGATADGRWHAYRLLAGSPAAPRLLRAVATSPHSEVPRLELLAALRDEVTRLAACPGEEALELDLLWALLPLARRVGQLHELGTALERALALSQAAGETDRFVALATLAAELAQNGGRTREAEAILRRALAAATGRDERRKGLLVVELGKLLVRQGRLADARELLERALAAFESRGRGGLAATCRFLLGNVAVRENRWDEAETLHQEALATRRRGGLSTAAAASLSAIGALRLAQGDYPHALVAYREAEEILAEHGSDGEESFALIGLGRAYMRLGDHEGAAPWLRRALALREGRDDRMGEAIARLAVAAHLLELEQVERALVEARRAHFDLSLLPESDARADAEHLLGRILLRQRRFAEADRSLAEAERIHREAGMLEAAARDVARRLEVGLVAEDVAAISRFSGVLAGRLESLGSQRPTDEPFDFLLFRAADWLRKRGVPEIEDPLPHLRRAYAELMRQTAFLEPEQRSRFLFGIPHHRAILEEATLRLISAPGGAPSF